MNRIAQQHHTGIAHVIARHLARYAIAGGLGALLALPLAVGAAGCAVQTAEEGDTSSTAAAGNDKTIEAPLPGTLPPAVRTTPNSQPGAARGAAPAVGPGQDPQPSPWIGTDNADQGSPLNRQQMGASVEHK